MRASELFGKTLRETPSDVDVASHSLLIRGGFIRVVSAGVYSWLPLGRAVLHRIEGIVREEMESSGAQEILMPALMPKELLSSTGRWEGFGAELYRLKDASGRDLFLGPTHEELVTSLASSDLNSYRDLPLVVFQIQWKFRYAARPRGGLLRAREFPMKDAYSFDADEEGMRRSYEKMVSAYQRVFERCQIDVRMIEADPGVMGGGMNQEFVLPSADGETDFVECENCGYTANLEISGMEGKPCPNCGGKPATRRGIELGHIFQLGTKYSEVMEAEFLDRTGKSTPYQMGCYGLGISRMVAALVDSYHDELGIKWPRALAPFEVVVLLVSQDSLAMRAAQKLYEELENKGVSAVIDDRDVTAGVKFADADLIGYPIQVIFGKEFLNGRIELRTRSTNDSALAAPSVKSVREALASCL
ncbi:MAG: proline--tRNA ligase [Actinobacteria bacterium]|nr:proline--tRNA ligase [Actinomycetota bacterium]